MLDDNDSVANENVENINKESICTRVDLRIEVPLHSSPEEKSIQLLKEFLRNFHSSDSTIMIAP